VVPLMGRYYDMFIGIVLLLVATFFVFWSFVRP